MRVLFDIVHPAHVHFFKHVIRGLEARGHQTRVVAREKDVTTALLNRLGIKYETVGHSGRRSLLGHAAELIQRDWALARVAREFRADMILTRSPAGAEVGRLLGIRSVFDTDDGRAAGIHYYAAAPFAHIITTPSCTDEDYGGKHVTYAGYKQGAYLHPNHFTPDPGVRSRLGVRPGERYFIVRFVEMVASHDAGKAGLSNDLKWSIIERLRPLGRVFATHERQLPPEMQEFRFPLPPDELHHAVAFADLLVGDSQTMAAEGAVLGTPSLRLSSFAGRLAYLREMEERYGLTYAYKPEQASDLLAQLDRWLSEPDLKQRLSDRHRQLMAEKIDVADWMLRFVEAGAPQGFPPR